MFIKSKWNDKKLCLISIKVTKKISLKIKIRNDKADGRDYLSNSYDEYPYIQLIEYQYVNKLKKYQRQKWEY